MWLVDSQCDIVGILLNFHMWTGVKNFRPESGVKFFIHEIFHTWNRCEFSIRHVQPCSTCEILNLHTFQTCFWCESGMKQAWSYEKILYGVTQRWLSLGGRYCEIFIKRKGKWFEPALWNNRLHSRIFIKQCIDQSYTKTPSKINYTTIADRLKTVSWSDNSQQTGMFNMVYGPNFRNISNKCATKWIGIFQSK